MLAGLLAVTMGRITWNVISPATTSVGKPQCDPPVKLGGYTLEASLGGRGSLIMQGVDPLVDRAVVFVAAVPLDPDGLPGGAFLTATPECRTLGGGR